MAMAPSATLAITQKARSMIAQGHDVITLSSGEPDFDTDETVKMAAIEAMARGETKYTAVDGIMVLKQAICDKFARENGLSYTPENINVSPGGKAVLFNAFMATLNPQDEVIIPTPAWVSYPDMVKLAGGTPVLVNCPSEQGFKLTPAQLEAAITPHTKWLILNSPSNPTGAVYSADELKALGAILERNEHVLVLCDDIYEHLLYEGEFATLAQACPNLFERVLTMNGVSKGYAMTGWRIGFAGGPKGLIDGMRKVMGQSTTNPSSISQWAAVAALTGPQDNLSVRRATYQRRRDFVVEGLNAMGLSCDVPRGAFYAYPSVQNLLGKTSAKGMLMETDVDVASALIEEALVATVPGTAFNGPGHIRLSYATDDASLHKALERLSRFVAACR